MFTVFSTVTKTLDKLPELQKSLEELRKSEVYVGIPEGDVGNHEGITNPQLLYIQTHGVRKKDMQDDMNEYMGLTPGGMPIMRDFELFSKNLAKGMSYSSAYDLFLHEHGSALWRIPPRPVLEPAINHHKEEIAMRMKHVIQLALSGQNPTYALGTEVGFYASNVVKNWFRNPLNRWPPNSPVTIHGSKPDKNGNKFIKGKNSDRPLIDTENLRNSIIYVIAKKG